MRTKLSQKVWDLEAEFWAKAEIIRLPIVGEALDYVKIVDPLDTLIFMAWEKEDVEAAKTERRIKQMEKTLPPIHPAFLPDYADATRLVQWGYHRRADYRALVEKQWTHFLEYGRSRYDLTDGGLLGIALRLFEKEIDKWMAQRKYIGRPTSREEMADDQIELWRVFRSKCRKADEPPDSQTRKALWQQSQIECVFTLHGREMTEADLELDYKMWAQLDEDMAAGKSASESEAAAYFRGLFDRYPRIA
jgi:hypothetical protein